MIILFGAAGSGKSLQGQRLAKKYGCKWMSAGHVLREMHDPKLDEIMKTGDLVDDNIVVKAMHKGMMEANLRGRFVVLDGYPRNDWQAKWLIDSGDAQYIDGAIIIDVPHKELWKRLEERGRYDDNKESIEARWGIFEQTITEMTEILSKNGVKVAHVDGIGTIDEVGERIEKQMKDWEIIV